MNNKGVTLVELVVVVAIIGIISTVIANVFIFGNKTFNKVESRSAGQMDVRIVVQTISKELRYADDIELFKKIELLNNVYDEDSKYIYFDESSKKVMKKEGQEASYEFLKRNQQFEKLGFSKNKVLKLFISSKQSSTTTDSDIETAISLLNQKLDKIVAQKDIRYKVIKYKKSKN